MKAHWQCEPDGNSYLTLYPENTDEMEQLANVAIYAGRQEKEVAEDDTPETFPY